MNWLPVLILILGGLEAHADVPECGDSSATQVEVSSHEFKIEGSAGQTKTIPACAFLKIHRNRCFLGMCFGTDRRVRIPIRLDEERGVYVSEPKRVRLRRVWVPGNMDCWEIPEYEVYEFNFGKRADSHFQSGRVYLQPGDESAAHEVVLDRTNDNFYRVCE